MEANDFVEKRATVLALSNMGLNPGDYETFDAAVDAYIATLKGAGLNDDQAANAKKVEVDGFARDMIGGKFVEEGAAADTYLVLWTIVPEAELPALVESIKTLTPATPEKPARQPRSSTPKEPVLQPIPDDGTGPIAVGDVIEVAGSSWKGFLALVRAIDQATGWVHVYTQFPSGKPYSGKVRFDKFVKVLQRGAGEWENVSQPKKEEAPAETPAPAEAPAA